MMTFLSGTSGARSPLLPFVVLLAAGCSRDTVQTQSDPTTERLRAIATAYGRATDALKRPPRGAEELKAHLPEVPGTDPAAVLISPNDQKPFVIVGGVDIRPADPSSVPVVAYEHTGSGGDRCVVDARLGVRKLSASEFEQLRFPADHKRP